MPLGIVVNQEGRRFYDEGEDFWPKRYAIWGRLVAQQPGQIGHVIVDRKAIGKFIPPVFPPVQADTIRELAGKLGSIRTCWRIPSQVQRRHPARDVRLDGARRLPHRRSRTAEVALGVAARRTAFLQLLAPARHHFHLSRGRGGRAGAGDHERRQRAANIFAAGEIMAGNVLGQGYLAGSA